MLAIDSVVSTKAFEVQVAFFQVVYFRLNIGRVVNDVKLCGEYD